MKKPIAVLVADIHYSLSTLFRADKAFRMTIDKAAELGVPLVDCGDLTNDKAVLRAEVISALIETMKYAADRGVSVYALVGNHSLVNEKGLDHALEFLTPYCEVISSPVHLQVTPSLSAYFIPYHSDIEALKTLIAGIPKNTPIFMHQGVTGANMGDYIQDKTALSLDFLEGRRVISGHYHQKQDIGSFSYVGNPYTLTFGEAKDGPKGFQVLHDDFSLEFVPTNLRKHVILHYDIGDLTAPQETPNQGDLVWIKVSGADSELKKLNKAKLGKMLGVGEDYRLDLLPTEHRQITRKETKSLNSGEVLDLLIDSSGETPEQKKTLKQTWRELL